MRDFFDAELFEWMWSNMDRPVRMRAPTEFDSQNPLASYAIMIDEFLQHFRPSDRPFERMDGGQNVIPSPHTGACAPELKVFSLTTGAFKNFMQTKTPSFNKALEAMVIHGQGKCPKTERMTLVTSNWVKASATKWSPNFQRMAEMGIRIEVMLWNGKRRCFEHHDFFDLVR